jgi:hypothetical protein
MKIISITKMAWLMITFMLSQLAIATDVSGLISTNTNWTKANSPYVVTGNLAVESGVSLVIEAGVEVRINSNTSILINGEIVALGTVSDSIKFTANSATPTKGYWGKILLSSTAVETRFEETSCSDAWVCNNTDGDSGKIADKPFACTYSSGSVFRYCTIEYGGSLDSSANACLEIMGRKVLVENCGIRYSSGHGIYLESNSLVRDCIIENNYRGLYGRGACFRVERTIIRNNLDIGAQTVRPGCCWSKSCLYECTIKGNGGNGVTGSVHLRRCWITDNGGMGIRTDGAIISFDQCVIARNRGGGIRSGDPSTRITRCIIAENTGGRAFEGRCYFIKNVVYGNKTSGSLIRHYCYSGVRQFDSCVVMGNTSDVVILVDDAGGGKTSFSYNIFHNNNYTTGLVQVGYPTTVTINAENNWWGTDDETVIQAHIFDFFDDASLGIFDYLPFLNSPDSDCPVTIPSGLTGILSGKEATLSWLRNPETDLLGYKLYKEDSLITELTSSSYVVTDTTGLGKKLRLTAVDNDADGIDDILEGHESWYAAIDLENGIISIEQPIHSRPVLKNDFSVTLDRWGIHMVLENADRVSCKVYNIQGRLVASIPSAYLTGGKHYLQFNGHYLPAGNYLLSIRTATDKIVRKCFVVN